MAQRSPPAAADQPRCPLGFTGTPPAGHPTFPSFSGQTSKDGTRTTAYPSSSSWTTTLATLIPTSFNPKNWTTEQTLFIEAVFLLLCVVLAVYMPTIKYTLGSAASSQTAGGVKPHGKKE